MSKILTSTFRPFFKKSEHFHPPTTEHQARHHAYYDPNAHGTDGPIHIIYPPEQGAAQQYWHATLNNLGVETNHNPASGEIVGCWTALAGVDPASQTRCYSASAYYAPAAHRENLVLLAEATVREIVLEEGGEGKGWAAKGVRFVHEGKEHIVRVAGEVILSAGTVQSPQLLELSGIGNPEILRAAGIDVKVENANVGENLQEHMRKIQNLTYSCIPKQYSQLTTCMTN
jgi:choline dehydrogenase-like flavoprotein